MSATQQDAVFGVVRRPEVVVGLALALALVFGFLMAPRQIVGTGFAARAGEEFPRYIVDGRAEFTPGLASLVDDWQWYHVIKAVFAALLVALALYLGHRALALIPTVLLIANVQGSVAPLSSAFSLLGDRVSESDGPLAEALSSMRRQLRGARSPAVQELVDDFARYHLAVVIMAAVLTVVLVAFAVRAWRQDRRRWAVATLVGAIVAGVVTAANVTNTLDPIRGLLDFLGGS
ncbi:MULTISPECIES: hypothetical protein [Tsukamurella]|uniref:Uncharacterized protein n=2 Tax=Tsukamurella TaxID=2060 RepID=A0A5C5S0Y9_9ACTN|nr:MULTISPECIES: hypothetical protein [Tsukamurella]NMD54660.1 hypothetical protein [Tsukamurella columbiensis]TWS28572.1 hypothetical protein FK530_13260 [Tsukamurella conjunctivitidis]